MSRVAQLLLETPLGKELSAKEASELAQACTVRSVSRGTPLFHAGEQSASLFVIVEGTLDVVLGKPMSGNVVASLSPGHLAGELEVMTKTARLASLVATDDVTLLELPTAKLEQMVAANHPAAVKLVLLIARTLARRMAMVNQRLIERQPPAPGEQLPAEPKPALATERTLSLDDADMQVLDHLWS